MVFRNGLKRFVVLILLFGAAANSSGQSEAVRIDSLRTLFGPSERFERSRLIPQKEGLTLSENDERTPSMGKAFLLSFVLPGAGEYYAGSKRMGKIFFGIEALLWATFAGFRTYGDWKKNDYIQFAAAHAGVDGTGKDHTYYVAVENYDNIRDYNDAKLRQRNVKEMYPENKAYSWQWDGESSRKTFEKLRIASDNAYSRSLFVIGGIVLNHIVSGIDALRAAKKDREVGENRLRVSFVGLPEGGASIILWTCF